MITLIYALTAELLSAALKNFQDFYDRLIIRLFRNGSFIQSLCCPGGVLTKHGYYLRYFKSRCSLGRETLRILRVRCSCCGRTHAILPQELIPYCRCCAEDAVLFVENYLNGKSCPDALKNTGGALDENDCRRCIRRYAENWKARIESINLGIKDFAGNFHECCRRCAESFSRLFLQMRDPPKFAVMDTT